MIYAKIHEYEDKQGEKQKSVITSPVLMDGFKPFDVPSHDHLTITNGKIVVKDDALNEIQKQQQLALILEQRRAAYPPITDYLDAIVKGDKKAVKKYIDDCQAVKAKYPKPE